MYYLLSGSADEVAADEELEKTYDMMSSADCSQTLLYEDKI